MCKTALPHGMRCFLLALLHLLKSGKQESCRFVEDHLGDGIATVLNKKYSDVFASFGVHPDNLAGIDGYYKQQYGCADGREQIYGCSQNDGICLLIALALNEIH